MLNFLKLSEVGPSPNMEIHFKPRMNFLTGDNGLGKTFLLDIAWWVLTMTWAKNPVTPPCPDPTRKSKNRPRIDYAYGTNSKTKNFHQDDSFYSINMQAWLVSRSRPPNPGLVIYAQVDGGFSAWDPARNYYWKGKGPAQPGRPTAFLFKPENVWQGLSDGSAKLCNGLIADWANWQREGGKAFRQLTSVLASLSPTPGEVLKPGRLTRIGLSDSRDHPTLSLPYQQDVPLVTASAGMRRIVALGYLLVWTWQEHLLACKILRTKPAKDVIFLIDEMEAHLHPQWQRRIVRSLLDVMEALTGTHAVTVQMIATTHSPLVLASVEPYFRPTDDAIWELDLVNGQVELSEFPWRRLGTVNNWLTSSVFDLNEPFGVDAESAIDRALGLLGRTPQPSLAEFEEVDQQLRAVLGDTDPFWVRWGQNMERLRGEG